MSQDNGKDNGRANGKARANDNTPSVFLALPTYDGRMEMLTAAAAFLWPTLGKCRVGHYLHRGSLLASGFNSLWCQALNLAAEDKVNRFAMLHADVVPTDRGFLDKLERVLQETGADVVSAVIPIKDTRGVTSTALGDPDDPWRPVRRLTMREVFDLPETFRGKDLGHEGPLLVNTGCMMVRMDRFWPRTFSGFQIQDRVVEDTDGRMRPMNLPEDWAFSDFLWRSGVDVVATRAVSVSHIGRIEYVNNQAWGSWERDLAERGED